MPMAFNPVTGLLNTTSYQTTPANETAARQQFMDLFYQLRDYLNNSVIDANGNVITNFPTSKGQNPNLLFNPSSRMGLNGWSNTGYSGSSWSASFGTLGEGGAFGTSSNTGAGQYDVLQSTKIPMSASQTIAVQAEFFLPGGLANSSSYIQVNALDSTGTNLGNTTFSGTGVGWTKNSTTYTTPANTASIQIALVVPPSVTIPGGNGISFRKVKVELGSVATTFSDDSTLNYQQYGSVLPLLQSVSGGNKMQSGNAFPTATLNTWVTITVTFPTAFTSAPTVTATFSQNGTTRVHITASAITTTSFTLGVYNLDGSGAVAISWIAVGS